MEDRNPDDPGSIGTGTSEEGEPEDELDESDPGVIATGPEEEEE